MAIYAVHQVRGLTQRKYFLAGSFYESNYTAKISGISSANRVFSLDLMLESLKQEIAS